MGGRGNRQAYLVHNEVPNDDQKGGDLPYGEKHDPDDLGADKPGQPVTGVRDAVPTYVVNTVPSAQIKTRSKFTRSREEDTIHARDDRMHMARYCI